jgi:GAF domain-containing protein
MIDARLALLSPAFLDDTLDDTIASALTDAIRKSGCDSGAVSLFLARSECFLCLEGVPESLHISRAIELRLSPATLVLSTETIACDDSSVDSRFRRFCDTVSWRSYAAAPLMIGDIVVGAVAVGSSTLCRPGAMQPARDVCRAAAARVVERLQTRSAPSSATWREAEWLPFLRVAQAAQVGALDGQSVLAALALLPDIGALADESELVVRTT